MVILVRLLALVLLAAVSRFLGETPSPTAERMKALSWPRRIDLCWRLIKDNRISPLVRGLALLPALYLMSPIDVLPDFIPFLGRLDDALIFGIVVSLLARFTPASVLDEHIAAMGGSGRGR